jgi:hypothetical protein
MPVLLGVEGVQRLISPTRTLQGHFEKAIALGLSGIGIHFVETEKSPWSAASHFVHSLWRTPQDWLARI